MAVRQRFLDVFGWRDAVLAGSAALGLILFLFAAPHVYPDSAASNHLPREEAVAEARIFAESAAGLHLEDAVANAVIRRRQSLLDSLQVRWGRREAIRRIRIEDVPAYYWSVTWSEGTKDGAALATVQLTLSGRPLGLSTEPRALSSDAHHEEALGTLTSGRGAADSLDRRSFRLDRQLPDDDRSFLDRDDAVRLARFHLAGTTLGEGALQIDSVFASGEDGVVTATVRASAAGAERWFSADVEVLPTGTLVSMEPSFTRSVDDEGAAELLEAYNLLLFTVLGLVLVVVFFRRTRLVDTKAALRDAFIGGATAGVATGTEMIGSELPDSAIELALLGFGVVMISFAAAAFIFFISGAANSIARDRWDAKLRSLDLARQLFIRNIPVGLSLVRGVLGGLALIGLAVAVLLIFPRLAVHFTESDALFVSEYPVLVALQTVCGRFFYALFVSYTAVLGLGALLRIRTKTAVASTIGIVTALAFVNVSPFSLRPFGAEFALSAVLGMGIAWMFWRFDFLSAMTTIFVLVLTAASVTGWSVPSAPEFFGSLLILLTVFVVLGLGLAGTLSAKTSQEVPLIVPEYIEELAQRERLQREFELGREVQLSFLPVASPHCPGLDIASICLPAHEVGGDYYDFFPLDEGRLGLVVGDVSGKGMQAAFYMTLMKGILQGTIADSRGPTAVLCRANELFRTTAPRGAFMSMVLGTIDTRAGTWTFARAGHNPVLLHRRRNDHPEAVRPGGAAIGLATDAVFANSLEECVLSLAAGDLILIYTDGVTEAMNERRELYEEDRLQRVVERAKGRSAQEVIDAIVNDVHAFCGSAPRHDDMTMVAVRVT